MGIFGPLECRSRRDKFQYGCPTHFQLAKNKPVTKRASKQLAGVLAEIHECENIIVARGLEFKWGYCLADWILGPMHAEKIKFVKEGRVPVGVKPESIAYGALECQIYLFLRINLALFGLRSSADNFQLICIMCIFLIIFYITVVDIVL